MVTLVPENLTIIDPSYLPDELKNELDIFRKQNKAPNSSASLRKQLDDYEAEILKQTLINCNWNQSKAARILHTSESNIRYKIEKLDIRRP